jgi:hypothetical protein
MRSMFTAIASTLGHVALVFSAAGKAATPGLAYVHFAVAAVATAAYAIMAIRTADGLRAANATAVTLAASNAYHLAHIWLWGALGIAFTYGSGILSWREWFSFFLAFCVAAGLSLFFSSTLSKDATAGKVDATLLQIAHYLTIGQLVGMGLVVVGLIVDGKMTRFKTPRFTDWAANNIFFCGAVAVAVVCAYALKTMPRVKPRLTPRET